MIEMKKIKEQQSQESHSHDHGKMPVVLYFIGLALALTALFLNDEYSLLKNILFSIASVSAGFHVIVLEGIGETVENTKK